jgi:hypothetical protein
MLPKDGIMGQLAADSVFAASQNAYAGVKKSVLSDGKRR